MLSIQQFLTKNMTPVPYPLHSPSLSPSNFFCCCFPNENNPQREMFADVEEVKQKMAETLKVIKTDDFKNCLEQRKKHLDRCIASKAEYFEGD